MTYLHVVNLMDFAYTETKLPFPGTLSNVCFTVHVTHLYSFAFSSTYRYFELGSVKALFVLLEVKTNLMTFTANCHAHGYKISEFPIFTLPSVKCE